MILLFLDDDGAELRARWWQLAGGAVAARGLGAPPPGLPVLAVAPADAVSLHRVALPRLAPAQALAAARALAGELSAVPLDRLHIAISAAEPGGERWLALIDRVVMQRCVEALLALAPDAPLLPAPLLLPGPGCVALGNVTLVRTADAAMALEPDLLALALPEVPQALGETALAAAAPGLCQVPTLDLRQGAFARVQPFRLPVARMRRLAALAAALALLLPATEAARLWQATRAEAAAVAARDRLASGLLPPGTVLTAPLAQVEAEAARRLAGGFTARATALMQALEARPGVALAALEADAAGLVATLEGANPGDVAAITQALAAAGVTAIPGLPRDTGGRRQIELRLGGG